MPAAGRVISPPELPGCKKQCIRVNCCQAYEVKSTIGAEDINNTQLVGFTWPPLACVLPWIQFKAQNMMEPTWRKELQCIQEDAHIRYMDCGPYFLHVFSSLDRRLLPSLMGGSPPSSSMLT